MVVGPVGEHAGGCLILRLLVIVCLVLGPQPTHAQTSPSLAQVDSLVMAGRTEDARQALMTWWDGVGGLDDSRQRGSAPRIDQQHAAWLRAVLTVDPAQASVDYQRLLVEYPGGPYSDRALLRLAQAAEARGDVVRALGYLRTLLRDYPTSPARLDAGRMLPSVESAVRSQAPVDAAASTSPVQESVPAGTWTVQLGAFMSIDRARALRESIGAGHLNARIVVVPPSDLIRVRTGRFETKARAEGLRSALAARGLEATVAEDADQEEATP